MVQFKFLTVVFSISVTVMRHIRWVFVIFSGINIEKLWFSMRLRVKKLSVFDEERVI